MPNYQPGDVIRDRAGNEVVLHVAEGASSWCPGVPHSYFKKVLEGTVSIEEYVATASHHVEVGIAYDFGEELPEGAIVTHEPERVAEMLQA
jgi:hypothetical protein